MLKKLFIAICCILLHFVAKSQSVNLPNSNDLFNALRLHHDEKRNAILAEYSAPEKYKAFKWFPQMGIIYTINNQPRPSVSYNLNQVYTNLNDKEKVKAKVKNINLSSDLEFKTDSLNLISILLKIKVAESNLKHIESTLKIDSEIWEIHKKKYEAKEITPIQFLTEQRLYMQRSDDYFKKLDEIDLLKIEALKIAHY